MATDETTIRNYNEYAEQYDAHVSVPENSPYHTYYEKPAIRSTLPRLAGLDVLSIGCGSGHDTQWLLDNGAGHATGIDISDGLINIARRNYPAGDFRVMDMEALGFESDRFDLLYSSLAIHYLDDWTTSLKEAYRVTKPGGFYVFSCNHPLATAWEHVQLSATVAASLLGHKTDTMSAQRTVYGNYLIPEGNGTKRIDTQAGGIDIVVYHKTMSVMVREILMSGFAIDALIEPQPVDEMRIKDPKHYEQLTKLPAFMVWRLKKT